ncbi:MAG: hypothetical protein HQ567_18850 [Candidatus Nealsonbacteria bacterium]|nr:hypothetical protein [Candidatus Nealsonbacteria bacterium]
MLNREEYIEQAYFFRTLHQRMQEGMSTQELLGAVRHEVLSTTKLPFAIDFMLDELRLTGEFATAMAKMPHYFTPFQTFVVAEAEKPEGRFDFRTGLEVLRREVEYRAGEPTRQGMFLYQFEALCRNRLGYDRGLGAMADDPIFDADWHQWILTVRHQIGLFDLADMIYVRSEVYRRTRDEEEAPVLFGEKEGRIALANRRKDPLYLFAALARHLGYPSVPRQQPQDKGPDVLPAMQQRLGRLESRIKLLEEELRGGINLSQFYEKKEKEQ